MNLPFQKIHDIQYGYGRLLLPMFDRNWLAWFRPYGIKKTSGYGFHNCTTTGVY